MHTASTSAICALKLYQGNNKYNIRQYLAIQVEPSRWTCLHLECLETRKKSHNAQLVLDTRRGEGVRKYLSIHSNNSPWKARNTCRNHVINGWYLVSCYSCWQNTNAMYKESVFKITVKDCQKRSHLIIHIPSVHTITTLFRLIQSFWHRNSLNGILQQTQLSFFVSFFLQVL